MKKLSHKKTYQFSVIIEKDENGWYIGRVPTLKSCYTQAKTLPELYKRLNEVVGLCIDALKQVNYQRFNLLKI